MSAFAAIYPTMYSPQINGVVFVGSVPVPTEEICFRAVCAALPGIKRIPDGEPGERATFIHWQLDQFKKVDPRVMNPIFNPANPASYSEDEAEDIVRCMGDLETRHDDYAVKSYATFKKLKDEGLVSPDVRFQVCLPTPICVVFENVHPDLRNKIEPLYEKALLRALGRIQDNVPHGELAVQFDCPMEMGMLERGNFYGLMDFVPWFEPVREGILERMARMAESVANDVELGFHLCYGDFGHQHFFEPKSSLTMVDLSNALFKQCKRYINYLHMPVPKSRTDQEYFKPLQQLELSDTELVLGLVHYDDMEGTKSRIQAAGQFVDSFSIATECGMGRTPPEQLENILNILATLSRPTKP